MHTEPLHSMPIPYVQSGSCCGAGEKAPKHITVIQLTCRIALGVFAAFAAPIPFAITFGIGTIAGAGYTLYQAFNKDRIRVINDSRPTCAQGFLEYLSGTKFPGAVVEVATAVFIGAHINHDPHFYVPFCAVFVGFWAGRQAANGGLQLAGRTNPAVSPPRRPCCQ